MRKRKTVKPWKEKDEKFLRENYNTYGMKYCMKHLKRSESSIKNRAFLLGLQIKTNKGGKRSRDPITLKHINGTIKTFPNRKICSEETGIRITELSNLLTQRRSAINDWYDPTELETPIYIYDSDDNTHRIDHIFEFCLEHNLETKYVKKLVSGNTSYYNGFRKIETPKKPKNLKLWTVLSSPEKEEYVVRNIKGFSRNIGIHQQGFYSLKSNNRSHYKGWELRDYILKEHNKTIFYEKN
jgi:hypothetical protein